VALPREVHGQEPTAGLQNPAHFSEPRTFELDRQMMKHQAARDDVERVIGKRKRLDDRDAELDGGRGVLGLRLCHLDHLRRAVDADDCRGWNARGQRKGDGAGATSDIEDVLAGCERGELDEGVTPPGHLLAEQVVETRMMDQPACGRRCRLGRVVWHRGPVFHGCSSVTTSPSPSASSRYIARRASVRIFAAASRWLSLPARLTCRVASSSSCASRRQSAPGLVLS